MNAKVWVRALAPEPPPPIAGVSVTKGLLAEIAETREFRILTIHRRTLSTPLCGDECEREHSTNSDFTAR